MNKLGVVGSGTMGSGIGQTGAQNGYDVVLYDVAEAQLEKALNTIKGALAKRVEKGKMSQQTMDDTLSRIRISTDINDLSDRDVIVEAVVENVKIKSELFTKLEGLVSAECLLATNTSSLSLKEISANMSDPARLIGIHFFNPVPAMKLVELVCTDFVRPDVEKQARAFSDSLGKTSIRATDTPGFVVNFLQYPFRLNAIRMVEMGMATPEDIDTAAKLGMGLPMGPLELQDMIGLDVTYPATSYVYEKTGDPRMQPPELMRKMIEEGKLGRKSGEGFYKYNK